MKHTEDDQEIKSSQGKAIAKKLTASKRVADEAFEQIANPADGKGAKEAIRSLDPAAAEEKMKQAENARAHRDEIIGSKNQLR